MNASGRPASAPTWYTETMVSAPERGPLTSDIDVDVCVIGAGLAGLTAAREVARRGWSVVVMEAQEVAWNASGRNTGFVLPGFACDMDKVVKRVGLDDAKALWALSESGLELCARDHPRDRHAGRRSGRGRLAQGLEVGRRRRRPRHRPPGRPGPWRPDRRLAGRARARRAQEQPLFPRGPCSACVPHPSAQLRARPCSRGGSGRRAHLRADAGAVDRRHRRAQAHRHAIRPAARRPCRARRQRPSRQARADDLRHADAGLDLCDDDQADRRPARRGHHIPRRGERHRSRRQPLPDRRRRPPDVVGEGDHLGSAIRDVSCGP